MWLCCPLGLLCHYHNPPLYSLPIPARSPPALYLPLHSLFLKCSSSQPGLEVEVLPPKKKKKNLSHSPCVVAPATGSPPPPPSLIFKSPVGTLAVPLPKRLCPLVLHPQRASADRLVGDKSNSVTLVAGVMLNGWRRASPSEQMPALPLCPPSPEPNIISKAQWREEEVEEKKEQEEEEEQKRWDRFD